MVKIFFGTFFLLVVIIAVFEVTTTGAIGNLPAAMIEALQSLIKFCSTFQVLS